MPLDVLKKVKPAGMTKSIAESYEADKKAIDKAVKNTDTPVKSSDAKPTVSENPHNLDESSFDKKDAPVHKTKISGTASYLELDFSDVEGAESFVESVRNGVKELIRIVKSFFTWLWELVFNRVHRLRNRVLSLKDKLKGKGVKVLTPVPYPSSIWRLSKKPTLEKNPDWIIRSVADIHTFYNEIMKGQEALKKAAQPLPNTVTKEQTLNLVEHTTDQYAKLVLGKGMSSGYELEGELLPGGRKHRVTFSTTNSLSGYSNSMAIRSIGNRKTPEGFIPDANNIQRILDQVAAASFDIENIHKSQSSMTREFEKAVGSLIRSGTYETKEGSKAAYQYYTWLIGFQQKSVNSPLMYIFSVLNAALDFCETSIK